MGRSPLGRKILPRRVDIGEGRALQTGEYTDWSVKIYRDFKGGQNNADAATDITEDALVDMLNIERTSRDRLRRIDGHTIIETFSDGRIVRAMASQTSLENTHELLIFDPPYLGVRPAEGPTTFTDSSLPSGRDWVTAQYGGDLLATNRHTGLYYRLPGDPTLTLIADSFPGKTIGILGSRVFVGGAEIAGGVIEHSAVRWNDADGLYTEWIGFGSGFELLVNANGVAQNIIAWRSVGLSVAIILCAHEIWAAEFTGEVRKPAIFEPRFPGVGCIAEPTARVVDGGLMFLSDAGVQLFDGTSARLVSGPIEADLLPIKYATIQGYSAAYDHINKRYFLFCPDCTWVYELGTEHWHKESSIIWRSAFFPKEAADVTWDSIDEGTWDASDASWEDFEPQQVGEQFILGKDDMLAVYDRESDEDLDGNTIVGRAKFFESTGQLGNEMFSTSHVGFRHIGGGPVRVSLPDKDGNFVEARTGDIPNSTVPRTDTMAMRHTGLAHSVQVEIVDTTLEIEHVTVRLQPRSQRRGDAGISVAGGDIFADGEHFADGGV